MQEVGADMEVQPVNHFHDSAPTYIGGHDLHYQYIRNVNNAITRQNQQKQIEQADVNKKSEAQSEMDIELKMLHLSQQEKLVEQEIEALNKLKRN